MSTTGLLELAQLLRTRRAEKKMTLQALGDLLKAVDQGVACSPAHLSQVENGRCWPSEQLVDALDRVFDSGNENRSGLRVAKVPATSVSETSVVTAHLFKPVFVGAELAETDGKEFDAQLAHVKAERSMHLSNDVDLHFFPFGVAVAHETYRVEFSSIAELAVWRVNAIDEALGQRATINYLKDSENSRLIELSDRSSYAFSSFVVEDSSWSPGVQLETAIRLMSCPSIVIKTPSGVGEFVGQVNFDDDDLAFEESLLAANYKLGHGQDFGIEPLSYGHASWSATSYFPANKARALEAQHLIDFEIQLQSVWCYANALATGLGNGATKEERAIEAEEIRELVRDLGQIGPREDHQHRNMRDAIIATSRVSDIGNDAIEFLLSGRIG